MLECCDILKCIDELLYEIIDPDNNILYPQNERDIKLFEEIVSSYEPNNLIYYSENDKWYKYYVKTIKKLDKEYKLKYLLDITEIKKVEEKYQTDSLTSVLTRPTVLEKLSQELTECAEKKIPFSLVIGDIDYFKDVNDSYGHIAGDKVLKNLGNILLEHTSDKTELVGRYGGEEFLLFFKNVDKEETINKIIEIKNSLDKLIVPYDGKDISNITMSFGVYHINDLEKEIISKEPKKMISELINGADIALYKSKESGRNQTHIYIAENFIEKIDYN